MLIGAPASGKSTWRAANKKNHVIISSDDILDALAEEEGISYSEAFRLYAGRADKECRLAFAEAIKAKSDIIVDRTNMSKKSRAKFLSAVPSVYDCKAVVFRVERETLLERAGARSEATGKFIAPWVIDQMTHSYQPPGVDEFDEIVYIEEQGK